MAELVFLIASFERLPPPLSKSTKLIPMRKRTATICLTIAVLIGSEGVSASAVFQKGVAAKDQGDFDPKLTGCEQK